MNEDEIIKENIEDIIKISVNSKDELLVNISTKILKIIKEDNPELFI